MANRHELDAVSRTVPISLTRIYRGMAVNTKVFELLGYKFEDPNTWPDWFKKDPADFEAGDIIFRDPDGLPNGVFVGDRAPRLITKAIPSKSFEQQVDSLVLGLKVLSAMGFTDRRAGKPGRPPDAGLPGGVRARSAAAARQPVRRMVPQRRSSRDRRPGQDRGADERARIPQSRRQLVPHPRREVVG
jgi:predicted amidohydrolase YtcJ